MPRRAPPPRREYYEAAGEQRYDSERDRYPRHTRRKRIVDDDIEYRRRPPVLPTAPPPVDELERFHIHDRAAPPGFLRESFEDIQDPGTLVVRREREREREEVDIPPTRRRNPRDEMRIRHGRMRPREIESEEESDSEEEEDEEGMGKGGLIESSEEDDASLRRRPRPPTVPTLPGAYESDDSFVALEKKPKPPKKVTPPESDSEEESFTPGPSPSQFKPRPSHKDGLGGGGFKRIPGMFPPSKDLQLPPESDSGEDDFNIGPYHKDGLRRSPERTRGLFPPRRELHPPSSDSEDFKPVPPPPEAKHGKDAVRGKVERKRGIFPPRRELEPPISDSEEDLEPAPPPPPGPFQKDSVRGRAERKRGIFPPRREPEPPISDSEEDFKPIPPPTRVERKRGIFPPRRELEPPSSDSEEDLEPAPPPPPGPFQKDGIRGRVERKQGTLPPRRELEPPTSDSEEDFKPIPPPPELIPISSRKDSTKGRVERKRGMFPPRRGPGPPSSDVVTEEEFKPVPSPHKDGIKGRFERARGIFPPRGDLQPPISDATTEDDGEDSDKDDIVIRKERTRRKGGRKKTKEFGEEISILEQKTSSSSRSSSESPAPNRPRSIRMPPEPRGTIPRRYVDDELEVPRVPPAPSPRAGPSSSEDEMETYGRRDTRDYPTREEIVVERRSKGDPLPPIRHMSPSSEPQSRRKPDDIDIALARPEFLARPEPLDHERELVVLERGQSRRNRDPLGDLDLAQTDVMRHGHVHDPDHFYPVPDPSQERRQRRRSRRPQVMADHTEESEDGTDHRQGKVGRRYISTKDRPERLWTEITKDLVVREAIERAGYEYEETTFFYYIFSYLHYEDVSALVELSEEIRRARRRRIHEIHRERASFPPPPPVAPVADKPRSLLYEQPPYRFRPRMEHKVKERELVLDRPRRLPPGPPGRSGRW